MKKWLGIWRANKLVLSLLFAVITTACLLLQERLIIPSNYLLQQDGNFIRENMDKKLVFNPFDFTMFLFFCVIWYVYFLVLSKGIKYNRILWVILSMIYSLCMLIGYGFYYAGGLDFYFSGPGNILKAIIIFGGYYVLFYTALYKIDKFLEEYRINGADRIKRFDFLKRWLFIFIAWLPYIILKYPGSNDYDAVRQVDYWYGYYSGSALANPPLTTLIFGASVELGEKILNVSFGLFLYNLFQAIVMSACFAEVANYLFEKGIKKRWVDIYTILTAVLPIYPIYANRMVKDNLFSMGLMLYTFMLIEMIYSGNVWFDKLKYRLIYFVSIFLMCTFRFNGIYILLITTYVLLMYFLIKRRSYKKMLLSFGILMILGLFINWANNNFFYRVINNVYNSNSAVNSESVADVGNDKSIKSETVDKNVITSSRVFDHNLRCQMARVVCKYQDELSDIDKWTIDLFMDYSRIAEEYNPQFLDSVSSIGRSCSAGERHLFMRTWRKYLMKHPLTYIEAVLHKSYGFFYPGATNYWNCWESTDPQSSRVTEKLQYTAPENLAGMSYRFKKFVEDMEKLPFVYILESIGFAFWIILFTAFWLIRKRKGSYLIAVLPILLNFAIVLLGPNFYRSPRYGYPQVYIAIPLLLCVIMITGSSSILESNNIEVLVDNKKEII